MASSMPIPEPPRTPTPPPDDDYQNATAAANGLGLEGFGNSPARSTFSISHLSPMDENFPPTGRKPSVSSLLSPSSSIPLSATDSNSMYSPQSLDSAGSQSSPLTENEKGVFKFVPTSYNAASPSTKTGVEKRRGHKYKHSSIHISHQLIQEPTPRAPLQVRKSYDVPTWRELLEKFSLEDRIRAIWCCIHTTVAFYTLWCAEGSLAMTALSHLIFFDAIGAVICVAVEVLGKFEIWSTSSLRHPFGLQRMEVLAGFAMAVFLAFTGMDLISHNLNHILEDLGNHESHHPHSHERVSAGEVDSAALLGIVSTIISALFLKNHARIGKAMRFAYIESLPSILGNPSHFLTISCSTIMLLLPLLSIKVYLWIDRGLSYVIAASMCYVGFRLGKNIGLMLLMSYSGPGVGEIMRDIETDPSVMAVEEARFWQVHYGLCMANLQLRVRGTEDTLAKLVDRVTSLVKNRLGGGYGAGGQKWEVNLQLNIDSF